MMTTTGTTMIRYDGQLAAFAGRREIQFVGVTADVADDHPVRKFVHAMGVYASHVASGELEGPYTDEAAALFARTLLITEEQFAEAVDADSLAAAAGIPLEQARAALAEMGARRVTALPLATPPATASNRNDERPGHGRPGQSHEL